MVNKKTRKKGPKIAQERLLHSGLTSFQPYYLPTKLNNYVYYHILTLTVAAFHAREYLELHMGTFRGSSSAAAPPFSALFKESEIKGSDSPSFT